MGIYFTASGLKGKSTFHSRCLVEWPRSTVHLPFPDLISKLLVDKGKLAEPNEDVIIPKQKIDHFTLEKSKSYLPSIELDDDDEGDIAGPSGAAPSEVGPFVAGTLYIGLDGDDQLGEGGIHALNESLGRLEVRVNEGFAESFPEMLYRLRCD
ncbi:hypothetical protein AAC387_Pa10g2139 [Persea americana]